MGERTVMIVGVGTVGETATDYLALCPSIKKLIVADCNSSRAYSVAVKAKMASMHFDNFPTVESIFLDLHDEKHTLQMIKEFNPAVIINTATVIPSSFYNPLIQAKMREINFKRYPPAHNLAKDLVPLCKLMKAVKRSDTGMKVVNVASPDNSHPVLAKVGLSPTVGAGNVDIVAQCVRRLVANKLNVSAQNIAITLIGHYALYYLLPAGKIPFYLQEKTARVPYYIRMRMGKIDLRDKFDLDNLIRSANEVAFSIQDYSERMAAASAAKQVLSILDDKGEIVHGSGVNGIPGCVPTRLNAKGAKVVLPDDITLDEVIKMGEMGMKWTGIEKIEPDGTVIFTEEAVSFLENVLGIYREKMSVSEIEEMAKELVLAYKALEGE